VSPLILPQAACGDKTKDVDCLEFRCLPSKHKSQLHRYTSHCDWTYLEVKIGYIDAPHDS
jgi:hypothetical protein